jgi:hypothetical protein
MGGLRADGTAGSRVDQLGLVALLVHLQLSDVFMVLFQLVQWVCANNQTTHKSAQLYFHFTVTTKPPTSQHNFIFILQSQAKLNETSATNMKHL